MQMHLILVANLYYDFESFAFLVNAQLLIVFIDMLYINNDVESELQLFKKYILISDINYLTFDFAEIILFFNVLSINKIV